MGGAGSSGATVAAGAPGLVAGWVVGEMGTNGCVCGRLAGARCSGMGNNGTMGGAGSSDGKDAAGPPAAANAGLPIAPRIRKATVHQPGLKGTLAPRRPSQHDRNAGQQGAMQEIASFPILVGMVPFL
jgi:hypothetical protein